MTKELDKYYRDIDRKLQLLSRSRRAAILREHRGSVSDYLKDNPDATVKEIEISFGTPEQVAESFLQMSDLKQTEQKLQTKGVIVKIVLIAVGILVAAALILGTVYVVDNHKFTNGEGTYSPAMSGYGEPDPNALATY